MLAFISFPINTNAIWRETPHNYTWIDANPPPIIYITKTTMWIWSSIYRVVWRRCCFTVWISRDQAHLWCEFLFIYFLFYFILIFCLVLSLDKTELISEGSGKKLFFSKAADQFVGSLKLWGEEHLVLWLFS